MIIGTVEREALAVTTSFVDAADEIIRKGETVVGETLSVAMRNYVIEMLYVWLKPGPDRLQYLSQPLAILSLNATETELQMAGELGILLAGWFPEQAYHRHVTPSYFVGMAKAAFHRLSGYRNGWYDVSENVPRIVAVLSVSAWNESHPFTLGGMTDVHPYFRRRSEQRLREGLPPNVFLIGSALADSSRRRAM